MRVEGTENPTPVLRRVAMRPGRPGNRFDAWKPASRDRPAINHRAESNKPAKAGCDGTRNGTRVPTPNVAQVPLCPAMTRSGMTVQMGNRFASVNRSIDTTIIALRAIAGRRGTGAT